MQLTYFEKGFNYSQDGPGNRIVFHLQGCNMHCPWCANPEGLSSAPAIKSKQYRSQELNELIQEIISCRSLFFDGGGVTFSGGEATLQFDELLYLLQELKKLKIHTTIETNGTHKQLPKLFPYIDLLIMDFKQIDDTIHKQITGISNCIIKENITLAMKQHSNVLIRTPLINGFNTDPNYILAFINFLKQFPTKNTRFEFLKYHEYGKKKWAQYGLSYVIDNGFVTDEVVQLFETEYKNHGLNIVRT